MSKICPKCRREQSDERLIACERCKIPFVEDAELVKHFTQDELKVIAGFLLKDWRVYLIAGIALLIGVVLLFWQSKEYIRGHIEDFRVSVSNQMAVTYSAATNDLGVQFRDFTTNASNRVSQAYVSVTNQIAEEFQKDNIKYVVEAVAKGEAKSILKIEVQPTVDKFRDDALFIRTIARAHGYDFQAYRRLLEIGKGSDENSETANGVVREIDKSLARDRSDPVIRTFCLVRGTNVFKGPFGTDELALRFQSVAEDRFSLNREGFANSIAALKQPLFLGSLVRMFTNETDLAVADRLAIAISDLSKEDFHPRDFERVISWWGDHQRSFTNWPTETFSRGVIDFSLTEYAKAVESFEQILKLDSGADHSRALAIACYLELNQTNRATPLFEKFTNPTGFWKKWAIAKRELDEGKIENATRQIFDLSKNSPSDSAFDRGSHIFRNVDWALFDRLNEGENH